MQITLELLKTLKIENYSWMMSNDEKYIQVLFPLESGVKCEEILEIFKENIIDQCKNSVLSIIPCNLYYQGGLFGEDDPDCNEYGTNFDLLTHLCFCLICGRAENRKTSKSTAWSRFISTVGARMTVAQVVENIKSEAKLTFDFVCLMVIAT